MDSKALTKIQSIILISIIVVAGLGGVIAYVLLSGEQKPTETIKIGVCIDLDSTHGGIWRGAVLAAEQINAEGGILGRNLEIVEQDDDSYTPPFASSIATNAMNRLITIDKADFVIASNLLPSSIIYQEIAAEHRKILFILTDGAEELTQRVLDDYDQYKYFFRAGVKNETSEVNYLVDSIVLCREYTGFNKVALIYQSPFTPMASSAIDALGDYGFDVVLDEPFTGSPVGYSPYFAKAEAAGAEILFPFIIGQSGTPFVKEYYDRQSPMVMWGLIWGSPEETGGKCAHITAYATPIGPGHPFTNKTVSTQEAFFERWDEQINGIAAYAYDVVRFILPDAIERAGTIETEAVIEALEETAVETSMARRFVFTSSHDVMLDLENPGFMTQWQDGEQVFVYPKELMEEAGASYMFPDWPGPWD